MKNNYFKVDSWVDIALFIPKLIHVTWVVSLRYIRYLGEIGIYIAAFYFLFKWIGVDIETSGSLSAFIGLIVGSLLLLYFDDKDGGTEFE